MTLLSQPAVVTLAGLQAAPILVATSRSVIRTKFKAGFRTPLLVQPTQLKLLLAVLQPPAGWSLFALDLTSSRLYIAFRKC